MMHIAVDRQSGRAYSAVVTTAWGRDKQPLPDLHHGQKWRVDGDSACASQQELIGRQADGFTGTYAPSCADDVQWPRLGSGYGGEIWLCRFPGNGLS